MHFYANFGINAGYFMKINYLQSKFIKIHSSLVNCYLTNHIRIIINLIIKKNTILLKILYKHKQFQGYQFIRNMKNIHIYVFFLIFLSFYMLIFHMG